MKMLVEAGDFLFIELYFVELSGGIANAAQRHK
jgi:hypothetical protein